MLSTLRRTYVDLFRAYPALVGLAVVAGLAELAVAMVNNYALPRYVLGSLNLTGKTLGAMLSCFLIAETVLKLPFGRLSDRVGRRPLLTLGPLAAFGPPVLVFLLPARLWWLLFPLWAVVGAGVAALWPAAFAATWDTVPERIRGVAMSVINTVYVGAIAAGPLLGLALTRVAHAVRLPFLVAGALLLGAAVVGSRVRTPEPTTDDAHHTGPGMAEAASGKARRERARRLLPIVVGITGLQTFALAMVAPFVARYAESDLRLLEANLRLFFVIPGLVAVLAGMPLGHLVDRLGQARSAKIGLAVAAAGLWGVPAVRGAGPLIGLATVIIVAFIFGVPAWLALASSLAPREGRGHVMGVVSTAEGVGASVAPVVGGLLWDIGHRFTFCGAAAVLSLAALAVIALVHDPPAQASSAHDPASHAADAPGPPRPPARRPGLARDPAAPPEDAS